MNLEFLYQRQPIIWVYLRQQFQRFCEGGVFGWWKTVAERVIQFSQPRPHILRPHILTQRLKLQIYRLRRPKNLSWVPLIPLQKLPVRFSPKGLEKTPHILWFFFLTYYSVFRIFNSSKSEFLSFHFII